MAPLTTERTVGELVTERLSRSKIFEEYGIDYCCNGNIPLTQACAEKGLNADEVIERLHKADETTPPEKEADWNAASLTDLADHIERTHHVYLRDVLPRLIDLMEKVREAHCKRHGELADVQRTFMALKDELEMHMMKEEQVLFPMIRAMEKGDVSATAHCGGLDNPIRVMEHEHEYAGNALARLRDLTGGYVPPEDACPSYRAMLDALTELEFDLHQHIHKENNILFPRASLREAELMRA